MTCGYIFSFSSLCYSRPRSGNSQFHLFSSISKSFAVLYSILASCGEILYFTISLQRAIKYFSERSNFIKEANIQIALWRKLRIGSRGRAGRGLAAHAKRAGRSVKQPEGTEVRRSGSPGVSQNTVSEPRSVICSPNHIRNMVPADSVTTVVKRKPKPGAITRPAEDSSATAIPKDWNKARPSVP